LVIFGLVTYLQAGILSDSRLSKPIDFDLSLRQITDFTSDVTRYSGVQFSVAKNVQDLKVDVFVDKRPLRETLDKVAKVLNCDWIPSGKGYRLEMDTKNFNRERNFLLAEIEEEKKQLQTKLWASEYIARIIPGTNGHLYSNSSEIREQENKIMEPFQKAVQAAYATGDLFRQMAADSQRTAIQENLRKFFLGRVFLQFDNHARERFWQGEPFVASTFKDSQYKLYESDMRETGTHSYVGSDGRSVEAEYQHCVFFRYDKLTGKLKVNQLLFIKAPAEFGGLNQQGQGSGRSRSTYFPISESLKKLPFYEDLVSWRDPEATSAKFIQSIDSSTPTWNAPWYAYRKRLGDHLRWFHKATQIPVVAQADRSGVYEWIKLNRGISTATEYLRQLANKANVFTKEDQGFLTIVSTKRPRPHGTLWNLWGLVN
jgi:hypothetical protein